MVVAAGIRCERLHHPERDRQRAEAVDGGIRRGGVDGAGVAEDHVGGRATRDRVVALAADHDRAARPDRDRVVTARAEVRRRHEVDVSRVDIRPCPVGEPEQRLELGSSPKDVAVVAQHEVRVRRIGSVAEQDRADRVVACAAQHDRAPRSGLDVVVPADVRRQRLHHAERDRQISEAVRIRLGRVDRATVADHHVGRRTALDDVVALAADHDRVARPDRDRVVAAGVEVGRGHEVDVTCGRVRTGPQSDACGTQLLADPGDEAVVAEHEVRVQRSGASPGSTV